MVKYFASAMVLKAFSCSRLTRRVYRTLGNTLGGRKCVVGKMPPFYVSRIERMLRLSRSYGSPKGGDRLLGSEQAGFIGKESQRDYFLISGVASLMCGMTGKKERSRSIWVSSRRGWTSCAPTLRSDPALVSLFQSS